MDETMTIEEERRMNLAQARNGARGLVPKRPAQEKQGPRISSVEAGLMVGLSLLFDGAQALLTLLIIGVVLNSVISVIAWLTFFLWFHAKGMSYGLGVKGGASAAKNPAVINAAALLVGFVPILNALPERTLGIIVIIALEHSGRFAKLAAHQ